MGQKVSLGKASKAVLTRPEGSIRVDGIKVSYQRSCCCLRRWRRIAAFTFPRGGWWTENGVAACVAEGGLCVPLAELRAKDEPYTRAVRVEVTAGGKRLITGGMTLGLFLDKLEFLHFSLFCDAGAAGGFTSLRCNGHRCSEAAAPASCRRRDRQPPRAVAVPSSPPLAADSPPSIKVSPAVTPQADEGHTADEVAPACTPVAAWPTVTPPASIPEANDGPIVTDVAAAATTLPRRGRVRKTQEPPGRAPTPLYTLGDAVIVFSTIMALVTFSMAFYTFG